MTLVRMLRCIAAALLASVAVGTVFAHDTPRDRAHTALFSLPPRSGSWDDRTVLDSRSVVCHG